MGGVVVDQLLFRFSIYGSVLEIFAIKLESCQKSRRRFLPSQILGGGPSPKIVPTLTSLPRGTSREKFLDVTPTTPKVIGAHTLNFKPNLTCSPLNFFEDPVPVGGVRYQALVNL